MSETNKKADETAAKIINVLNTQHPTIEWPFQAISALVAAALTDARADERKTAVAETWDKAINTVKLTPILSADIHELSQGGTVTEIQVPFTAAGFKEMVIAALEAARDESK